MVDSVQNQTNGGYKNCMRTLHSDPCRVILGIHCWLSMQDGQAVPWRMKDDLQNRAWHVCHNRFKDLMALGLISEPETINLAAQPPQLEQSRI